MTVAAVEEIERLRARVAELEARERKLREALRHLLDAAYMLNKDKSTFMIAPYVIGKAELAFAETVP